MIEIRNRRKRGGWSQRTVAEMAGISTDYLGFLETGYQQNVTIRVLRSLEAALKCLESQQRHDHD